MKNPLLGKIDLGGSLTKGANNNLLIGERDLKTAFVSHFRRISCSLIGLFQQASRAFSRHSKGRFSAYAITSGRFILLTRQ